MYFLSIDREVLLGPVLQRADVDVASFLSLLFGSDGGHDGIPFDVFPEEGDEHEPVFVGQHRFFCD